MCADAQVEFQPNQEPFAGHGLREEKGMSHQLWSLEQQFESAFVGMLREDDLYLLNTIRNRSPARAAQSRGGHLNCTKRQ